MSEFKNITVKNGKIYFAEFNTTRSMRLEKSPKGENEAKTTLKVKGEIDVEKALKAALEKGVIAFRTRANARYDVSVDGDAAKWMNEFDGATFELDLDKVLSADSHVSDGLGSVRSAIKKSDNEKLIEKMMANGLTREQAELAINAF